MFADELVDNCSFVLRELFRVAGQVQLYNNIYIYIIFK